MKPAAVVVFAVLLIFIPGLSAQTADSAIFGRKNTFSPFIEYSNDSSHMILGRAPNRKFAGFGVQYERRLVSNHLLVWKYSAEFLPLVLESDPTESITRTVISPAPSAPFTSQLGAVFQCIPAQGPYTVTLPNGVVVTGIAVDNCSRRWTYAQGLSPAGTRINLMPHRRLQPTASFLAGYLLAAKKIPIDTAGSFNFTFEFGAGLEYYQSQSRSIRFEYQIHHLSNAYTALENPGVDSGLFKLSYTFGR